VSRRNGEQVDDRVLKLDHCGVAVLEDDRQAENCLVELLRALLSQDSSHSLATRRHSVSTRI
jgi:hypothetical protein